MALTAAELMAVFKADTAHMDRAIRAMTDKARRGFTNAVKPATALAGVLVKIGKAAVASVAVHALAGAALQLAGAASAASGALLVLPAAGAAAAAGVATLTIGLHGVSDAFKAMSGDPKQFAAALKDLAPSAAATVVAFKALGPAAHQVRMDVQQRLFAGFAGQVRDLGATYLPILRTRLADIAGEMNLAGKAAGRTLLEPASVATANQLLSRTRQALASLTPAVQPALAAMRDVVGVGARALPSLGASIAGVITRASAAISDAADSGRLRAFMAAGIEAARELGGVLANLGRIVGDVLGAAQSAGGGMLGTLRDLLGGVHEFLNSVAGQKALQTFFASASGLAAGLLPILVSVATTVATVVAPALSQIGQTLLPVIAHAAAALGPALAKAVPGITKVFDALAPALESLLPHLDTIGGAIGEVFGALAPVVQPLADAFGQVLEAVAPLVPIVARLFAQHLATAAGIAANLAQALGPVIVALANGLAPIVSRLAGMFVNLLASLAPVVITLVSTLAPTLPTLAGAFVQVVAALMPLVPAVVQLVAAAVPLVPLLAQIITVALQLAGPVIGVLASGLAVLIGWVARLVSGLVSAGRTVAGWANGVRQAIGSAVSWAVSKIGSLLSTVGSIPGKIAGLAGKMLAAGKALLSKLFDGFKAAPGFIGNLGATIVNKIIDGLNKILPHRLDVNLPGPVPDIHVPLIPTIPHLAQGATVLPRRGGTLAVLAEAGRSESVVDTGRMNQLIDRALGRAGSTGLTAAEIRAAVEAGFLAAVNRATVRIDPTGAARLVAVGNARNARRA